VDEDLQGGASESALSRSERREEGETHLAVRVEVGPDAISHGLELGDGLGGLEVLDAVVLEGQAEERDAGRLAEDRVEAGVEGKGPGAVRRQADVALARRVGLDEGREGCGPARGVGEEELVDVVVACPGDDGEDVALAQAQDVVLVDAADLDVV